MANAKRPDKISFKLVKPPNDAFFVDELFRKDSIYCSKLTEALNSDCVVQAAKDDKYLINQLRTAAKKLKIRLVFAQSGEFILVKPIRSSGEEERLVLLLREPRTMIELQQTKPPLELHLENTLQRMEKLGTAHIHRGKWVLTEAGFDLLPKAERAASA